MRTWLALIVLVASLRVAQAGHSIVVMSDPDHVGVLGSAMQVALAGRGVAIATLPAPTGELRLERAASAQRAALQLGADAALWIDADGTALDVCAVSADGRAFRHAPLPPDLADATPRAFSAIATSLLDELVAPLDPPPNIDVDVRVHVDGADRTATGFAQATPPPDAPAAIAIAAPGAVAELGIPRRDRTLFEVGPLLSPVTVGAMGEVSFPLNPSVRLGMMAGGHVGIDGSVFVYNFAGELRGIVSGRRNHFDLGGIVGYANANDNQNDYIFYLGPSFDYTWEGATKGTTLSIVPLVAFAAGETFPGAYASLRWDFAL